MYFSASSSLPVVEIRTQNEELATNSHRPDLVPYYDPPEMPDRKAREFRCCRDVEKHLVRSAAD